MEQIIDQLITVATGLGILAGAWLIWFISGVANNLFSDRKWSWKRMGEDVVKTVVMGIGILSWVILMNVLDWYTAKLGMDVTALLDGGTTVGLLAVIVGGSANYVMKAYKNFASFIGTDHVAQVVGEQDYAGVAQEVKDAVSAIYCSINAQQEDPEELTGEVLSKAETKKLAEMGSIPYVKYNVATPQLAYQNLLGKAFNEGYGFQCVAGFKEFMFCMFGQYVAAGGAAANYASEPAKSAVCELGFTWHDGSEGLENGDWGVWTNGLYGHVSMYYQGKWLGQNQGAEDGNVGNAFNLLTLPMQGFAGYFRPNTYAKLGGSAKDSDKATAGNSSVSPQTAEIAVGDKVEVVKYVDVNGTKLMKLQTSPYTVFQIRKSDRTAVLKSDDGDIYARMALENIKKVN